MPTIDGGKYIRYNNKRFFVMSGVINDNGTTDVPIEAIEGSIGVTTNDSGKSQWFVSDGDHWQVYGGEGGSPLIKATGADIDTGTDDAKYATAKAIADSGIPTAADMAGKLSGQTAVLTADFEKTNNTFAAVPFDKDIVLEAGRWYRITFEGQGYPMGEGGVKLDFNGGTATVTGIKGSGLSFDAAIGTADVWRFNDLAGGFQYVGNTDEIVVMQAVLTCQVNAGGTFGVRFAQNTTNETASALQKYSTITAIDITPTA